MLLIALQLSSCYSGPSCEERGGKRVLSHFNSVFTGKTTVMIPMYRCEGAQH